MTNAKHRQIQARIRSNPSQPTASQSSTWRTLQESPCEPPDAGSKRAKCPPQPHLSSVYATQGISAICTQTGTASDSLKASSGRLRTSTSSPTTSKRLPSTSRPSPLSSARSKPSGNSKPRTSPSQSSARRVSLVSVAGHDSRTQVAPHSPDSGRGLFGGRSEAMPAIAQARAVGAQGRAIHAAVPAQPETGSPVLGLAAAASVAHCIDESEIAAELTWRRQTAQRYGFETWQDLESILSAAGAAPLGGRECAAQSEGSEPIGSPLPEVSGRKHRLRLVPSPDQALPLTPGQPSGGRGSGLNNGTGFSGKPSRPSPLLAATSPRSGDDSEAGSSLLESPVSCGVPSNTPHLSPRGEKTAQNSAAPDPSELLDQLLTLPLFEGHRDPSDPIFQTLAEGFLLPECVYYVIYGLNRSTMKPLFPEV